MKVFKKIVITILCILIALVVCIGILIAIYAPDNEKAMKKSVDGFAETVSTHFTVDEIDPGDYSNLTLFGIMKFDVKQYDVDGVGNLATMTTNMGLMQMATVVLTPVERDIPLISMDYMYILGNRTAYLEFYDLVLSKDDKYNSMLRKLNEIGQEYNYIDSTTPSSAWYDTLKTEGYYKKGTKDDDEALIEMAKQGVNVVMGYGGTLPILDSESHAKKVALQKQYSDGLIENGGVSTDIFLKAMGEEETRAFFDNVLFKAQ